MTDWKIERNIEIFEKLKHEKKKQGNFDHMETCKYGKVGKFK
jgi:hypothetical protein